MKYTECGLQITLEELERIVEKAKHYAKYDSMESVIYIPGGEDRPRIVQYCRYADCNAVNHTYLASGCGK